MQPTRTLCRTSDPNLDPQPNAFAVRYLPENAKVKQDTNMEYHSVSTKNYWESPAIPLIIGEDDEKRVFYVHETLLIQTCEYFRIALQSQFVEGQEKLCRFPEDNQHAFHLLVQYLYR